MAIQHTVVDSDSIQGLALQYLGDASRWREIADYNKLDFPYLVTDNEERKRYFGSGYVTVIRANYQTAAILKAGWQFKTSENLFIGGIIKTFEVTEDTYIPAGYPVAYVPVRCTVPGEFGNVMPYSVSQVGENTKEYSGIQFVAIYNESQFTGGQNVNIKVTGDVIYVPTSASEVIPEDVSKMIELIGGEDLILDTEGNIVFDPSGDLASVSGVDNIRHAVNHRLMTEVGELTAHPEYGAGLADLVGSPNVANVVKLMEIAVIRALNQEDRIKEPLINSIVVKGTAVYLDISYKIAVSGTTDRFTTVI